MDRNRDSRRVSMAASNGLSRRRHRTGSFRDSTEDDGPVEVQERLRDRGAGKKDRDRERDRERDRDRDRDRICSRSKRRRGDRLLHGINREDGVVEDSSEESVNEEGDEDEDDGGPGASTRMLPPNPSSLSYASLSNHQQRRTFPPATKVVRASPKMTAVPWKAPDEVMGVSVPRKARSASTKRSHDCWTSGGGVVADQIHRQASTSPARSGGPGVTTVLASASASPAPVSSSSNATIKKKMKPNGPKQRLPKSSVKSASSTQEEIEMEIAQVLYGLMNQPQRPVKQEIMGNDLREVNKSSTVDAKSRVSSPISNSQSTIPHSYSVPSTNSSSSATPVSAIAPKRKRPRPVNLEDEKPSMFAVRNGPISSTAKVDADQPSKIENSPIFERGLGSAAENGGVSYGLLANRFALSSTERLQSQPEAVKPESNSINLLSDSKPLIEESDSKDMAVAKEEPRSPRKESSRLTSEDDRERLAPTKGNSKTSEMESLREEKFQIDLMAPPPMRSSPEGVKEVDFVAVDHKPVVPDVETETKSMIKEGEKALKIGKEDINVEPEEKKAKLMAEEVESQKPIVNKERNIDLQLDLEKTDGDSGIVTVSGNKSQQNVQKLQQQQPITERTGSVPLPMSMAGWPGGLPHMGYMAPLQGVVSMDGSAVSSAALQPPHLLFSQQRPKRCATHFYIAQNIQYNQQFTRMNSFWPAAAGSALQFGAKACNMNAVPTPEMQAGRGLNTVQGKGQGLAIFPGHTGKDKTSQATNIVDIAQKKQILLQQAVPHGAPNNLMHGPAFIFPLSQQQAAAAASVRPGTLKSPPSAGGSVSASGSNSASISAASTAVAGAPAMTFNYPNMPGNETQYLAILQNGAYPIPIPAHVGATPAYRGNHPQPMPFFNGTFYSPQILHHSQLQQQQPPATQSQHSQQDHHKPSISGGSSSSQKHLQNQQQRAHGSVLNGGSEKLQGFPALKSQPLQLQQQQQVQSHNVPHQARQLEAELGSEDSPSTADSQVSRANMSHCGQNFAVAMHPPNFALMHPASMSTFSGSNVASGNPSEKKQHQAKAQGTKTGVEPLQSQAFAMSFASINGATTAPGLDISSIAQNHALIQSLPEAARHGYHFMAAAAAPQVAHNKKRENDSSNAEEERKSIAGGKAPAISVPSIPFSRPDLTDSSASTAPVSSVMESSARTLNLGSSTAWTSGSFMSTAINNVHNPSMQQQMQRSQQQQQQQHMTQLQKQHQLVAAAPASTRNKTPVSSNGNVYPEPISSPASMAAKFPNALSAFPQNLVQSNSPAQSPQWKNSVRTTTSQVPAQSLASTSSSLKHLSQQQSRNQQGHTQISFAAGSKPSITGQGQPPPNGNQSRSPSVGMGSPTSSISKGAGGSPRTTLASTNNKGSQASTLSSQQAKITPSAPTQKSSPVGGRNIPSILGHPHNNTASSTSGTRPQLAHQQKHQQTPKHAFPQAHMLYTNAYMQAAGSANASSGASGFYLQRHREQQQQQPTGSSSTSTGMLLLCPPVTLSSTSTNDPAKAVAAAAAAAGNMKGGGLPSQGIIHAHFAPSQSPGKSHQLVPASFPYSHTLPPAVQVKPAEQKQPTGN